MRACVYVWVGVCVEADNNDNGKYIQRKTKSCNCKKFFSFLIKSVEIFRGCGNFQICSKIPLFRKSFYGKDANSTRYKDVIMIKIDQ